MELLLPDSGDAQAQIERLRNATLKPFDADILAFFGDFSQRVLADTGLRQYPELVALGYWFRPAAVARLRERHVHLAEGGVLRPRGVALHYAPSNVDSVFVYSWFLSLACGNRNIIRLSARSAGARRAALFDLLTALLQDPRHARIAAATAVVSFAHDDTQNAALACDCHLRVTWGGDAAVNALRRVALPPLATELVFPNRESWALLDASTVLAADETTFEAHLRGFYNDAFWFAQQACSSPRALAWVGTQETVRRAQLRFWDGLRAYLHRRGEFSDASELANRLVATHVAAAAVPAQSLEGSLADWPLRISSDALDPLQREQHCGYGLFYEVQRDSLAECVALFAPQDQTVAYWGFSRETLIDWAQSLGDRCVDRVVPLGKALQFSDRWDGQDLLQSFSRLVSID
ncbi:acyl-CoA reductase [Niveibacterium sp. SC-1]|uniref:acyl-CoA reductase n=1 Tax=Niveibacterium sp. SC-1 TaxID=3135646 RepID=UPI00311F4C26